MIADLGPKTGGHALTPAPLREREGTATAMGAGHVSAGRIVERIVGVRGKPGKPKLGEAALLEPRNQPVVVCV